MKRKVGYQKNVPRKKYKDNSNRRYLGAISGATLGFITGNVPGAFIGGSYGYKAGAKYDMADGTTVTGIGTTVSMRDPPGVVNPFLSRNNLPKNLSTMVYRTPRFRTPRSTGSSVFRTPGSSFRASRYRSLNRRRSYRRTGRFSYRARKRSFRGRFRKGRYFKRRRIMKRKAIRRRKIIRKNLKPSVQRSKGYSYKVESYGFLSDGHCVYFDHSTNYVDHNANCIVAAFIRKLFKKIGYDIPDMDIVLSGVGTDSPDGRHYRLLFVQSDPQSSTYTAQYAKTLSQFDTLATASADATAGSFYSYLIGYMLDKSDTDPISFELQLLDQNTGSDVYTTISKINLQNEYMYMTISSALRLQNRTLSAGAGSTLTGSTDVVDAQPLSGKVMTFKNGNPILRYLSGLPTIYNNTIASTVGDYLLNSIDHRGLDLIRGSTDLPAKYQEPPNKDKFANCLSSKKFILNPGECMQTSVGYKIHGRLVNVLKKLRPQRGATTAADPVRVSKVNGKCQLVILEEYIRAESANTVKVGYEREHVVSVWFQTKTPTAISARFDVDSVRNVS